MARQFPIRQNRGDAQAEIGDDENGKGDEVGLLSCETCNRSATQEFCAARKPCERKIALGAPVEPLVKEIKAG